MRNGGLPLETGQDRSSTCRYYVGKNLAGIAWIKAGKTSLAGYDQRDEHGNRHSRVLKRETGGGDEAWPHSTSTCNLLPISVNTFQ